MKKYLCTLFLFNIFFCLNAQNWDINTLHSINKIDNSFLNGTTKFLGKSTPYIVIGLPSIMGIYALIDKNDKLLKDAIYIGTSVIEAAAITYGAKYIFDRKRPYDKYPDKIIKRESESDPSFPSNHTASAFALATSLSITYPKWYVIAPSALWACSVGFARMHQGVHYPTDVFAGAILGSGCAVANIYVNRWLNKLIFPQEKTKLVTY